MSDTGITKSMIDSCFNHIQDDLKHNYKVFTTKYVLSPLKKIRYGLCIC